MMNDDSATQLLKDNASQTPAASDSVLPPQSSREQLHVAVIVPFRDNHAAQKRQAHLDQFVPHMTALLSKQSELRCGYLFVCYLSLCFYCNDSPQVNICSAFHIFIIEQSADGRKFNRGKLLNAGFDIARNDYDIFIFHDVDLLPGVSLY